jgi:uncharacterized membrane protein
MKVYLAFCSIFLIIALFSDRALTWIDFAAALFCATVIYGLMVLFGLVMNPIEKAIFKSELKNGK